MGDKISALVAALVLASIVLAFTTPVFAQGEEPPGTEPPGTETPETETPGTTPETVGPGENSPGNQTSSGGWPISPLWIVAIVGILVVALVIVWAWKRRSSSVQEHLKEMDKLEPPSFSLPLHLFLPIS